ncbi:MAG TPA: hypothetical protein VHB02_07665 [Acidimicrobiales bacterium]|nr:hypothetical protein [Acidimicrobiales bacterium]
MYLYVRQAILVDNGGLGWARAVRAGLQEALGQPVHLWQNAYSAAADRISWTCWCADLGVLEDGLLSVPDRGGLPDGRGSAVPGSAGERLFAVVHGDPDPASPGRYLRSQRAVGTAGHLDRGLQAGIEMAKKSEEVTGAPSVFVRAATGTMGAVAWLTPFDTMAEFQQANEKLLGEANWLWYRDRQAEATQSGSVSTALHRRIID